jgi:DNA invertase Pin-like site-specific DNA recombinase
MYEQIIKDATKDLVGNPLDQDVLVERLTQVLMEVIPKPNLGGVKVKSEDGRKYGRPLKLTASDVRRARDLYVSGSTTTELAEKFGVHNETMRRALNGRYPYPSTGGLSLRKGNKEKLKRNEMIVSLRLEGLPFSKIGEMLGISKQRVHQISTRKGPVYETRTRPNPR